MSAGRAEPIVRAAITALDAFGCDNRMDALILLPLWARYEELGPAQFNEVISAYPPPDDAAVIRARAAAGPPAVDDEEGWVRDVAAPPADAPPPDGEVLGMAVTGRVSLDLPLPRRSAA
ncbi:hypothetical protein [Phytohabitans rumicis]|uniref:Uncharacterized protein n=1 Tax=Phytohabitans rumicis TaxID=1076125 RepID=A0A6V8L5D2_9ACTN|nr:hypothetical protein [Phytohabitans rumicis]GFJ92453.1 hypothetical protein Prum_060950 [Phytohabitans rumicis]